ncbi:hypothetical protein NC652_024210 [Populus alba x Populus x berolinensis]|nr:hypothetical protein NC652_024210 [Populus alba x Populus x berolinensis]
MASFRDQRSGLEWRYSSCASHKQTQHRGSCHSLAWNQKKGTPWADGTASISQCAINPGESFDYRFTVDRAGTYFYHGHYGMQRSAGLYGSLIVDVAEGEKEPFHYDGEFDLLLSDWWHESAHHQEVGLSSRPMRWIGEPQTLLVNGRGQYGCSLAAHYSNNSSLSQCNVTGHEQWAPHILHVDPNKTYRIRLSSTTALASLNLAIGNHKMLVVEADGNYLQPFETDDLDIYSGRKPQTPQALTILNYKTNSASKFPLSPPPVTPRWDDYAHSKAFTNKVKALDHKTIPKPPSTYNRRIILLNTQNKMNGYTKWSINNVSLSLPATPYLGSIRFGLQNGFDQTKPPESFPEQYDVMKPPGNPNTTTGNGVYMLRYGEGKFTKADEKKFNMKNPPYRNSAVIFPYGWTALRFVADNPGVWAFHCHIEPHLHMGMGVVLAEGVQRLPKIPKEALSCGLTGKKFMTGNNLG